MRVLYTLALAGSLAWIGCTGERNREVAVSDSLSRDLELAPADTLAPEPLPEPKGSRGDTGTAADRQTQAGARTRPVAPSSPSGAAERRVHRRARAATPTPTPAPIPDSDPTPTVAYAPEAPGADTAPPSASPTDSGPPPPPPQPQPAPPRPAPDSTAVPAPLPAPASNALPAGTEFRVQLQDTINSLRNAEGQTVTGLVSGDVRAPDGLTVLPSGSQVYISITRLRPARTRSAADGELQLRVDSIVAAGHSYLVKADVGRVPHELRGRGVTAGEVEKVGAGAAAGAVVGGVVTGKTKGAVIGGVIGAAGGTVVAAQTASRDVVVTPGTLLPLVLREPVTRR